MFVEHRAVYYLINYLILITSKYIKKVIRLSAVSILFKQLISKDVLELIVHYRGKANSSRLQEPQIASHLI